MSSPFSINSFGTQDERVLTTQGGNMYDNNASL